MDRVLGWESRFRQILKDAQARPYHETDWNCAIFAATVVEALTGRPMPRQLSGTLIQTVDAHLPRIRAALARRGDVVLANLPEATLGVCNGPIAVFLGPSGLLTLPMAKVSMAWSV